MKRGGGDQGNRIKIAVKFDYPGGTVRNLAKSPR